MVFTFPFFNCTENVSFVGVLLRVKSRIPSIPFHSVSATVLLNNTDTISLEIDTSYYDWTDDEIRISNHYLDDFIGEECYTSIHFKDSLDSLHTFHFDTLAIKHQRMIYYNVNFGFRKDNKYNYKKFAIGDITGNINDTLFLGYHYQTSW